MAVGFVLYYLTLLFLATSSEGMHYARSLFLPSTACTRIGNAIGNSISSGSLLSYPSSPVYALDNAHWASSSSQHSTCSVEPGSAADVGAILKIVGFLRIPFAVKGGGHSTNPGFSSTSGVQISMSRFNAINYNANSQTVEIGAGLIWDDVYSALAPFGVSVAGGRVSGVGVAGFILGGGYSWKSNQYGLTIDTVQAFELVLPNTTVLTVTADSYPDLYFGLRGGYNNFGIVTKFTLKTFPQGDVWGGLLTVFGQLGKINAATAKFAQTNTDPKANIITTYNTIAGLVPETSILLFYDGPSPPSGLFTDFLKIIGIPDIRRRSLLSLVQSSPSNITSGFRGAFQTVPLQRISANILNTINSQLQNVVQQLSSNLLSILAGSNLFISYDVEPFLPNLLTHGPASAYPYDRNTAYLPLNLYFAWPADISDDLVTSVMKSSSNAILQAALAEGQNVQNAPMYPNYAISGTPLQNIYGTNLPRLIALKNQYDPTGIMDLAGGWKFTS